MQVRIFVIVAALALAGGLWCGSVLGLQSCNTACDSIDGIPKGAMSSHYCTYNGCTPGPGWCRTEICKPCQGAGATTSQCQNESACMQNVASLCSDTCGQ